MWDKLVNKIRGIDDEPIGYNDPDDITNEPIDQDPNDIPYRPSYSPRSKGKVLNYPQSTDRVKMVISKPTSMEEAEEICQALKEKKSIVINLEYVNKDVARRIIDFVSGGAYCLDGTIQKVSNSIILVAPSNYDIDNELVKEEIKNKLNVSWIRNNSNN